MTAALPPVGNRTTADLDGSTSNALADTAGALQRSALFACLPPEEALKLAATVGRFTMEPGPLFLEGDRSNKAYLLLSGRIDISVFSNDGRELLLYRVRPGDFFGEMALLNEGPRSASAVVRSRSEILSISRLTLLEVIARNPDLALCMIASLSERLRVADETIKSVGFLDLTSRLARLLLTMEREEGGEGTVCVSQVELASALGCMRQSVTRTLSAWRRMGYADTRRGHIRILNRRKLRAYAQL